LTAEGQEASKKFQRNPDSYRDKIQTRYASFCFDLDFRLWILGFEFLFENLIFIIWNFSPYFFVTNKKITNKFITEKALKALPALENFFCQML